MAKINVTEKDLSWYTRQGTGPLVIYLPGTSTWGPTDRPVLCSTVPAFTKTFGSAVLAPGLSLSYNMALSFIKAGASVLFQRYIDGDASSAAASLAGLSITSKYKGSFLNGYNIDMTVLSKNSDSSVTKAYFVVKDTSGVVKDKFTADFVDTASEEYFMNDISNFVDLEFEDSESPKVVVTKDDKGNEITRAVLGKASADDTRLSDLCKGKDSASVNSVSKVIVNGVTDADGKVVVSSPLSVIEDPYLYDFDVAISAGFTLENKEESSGNEDEPSPASEDGTSSAPKTKIDLVDKAILSSVKSRAASLFLVDGTPDMDLDDFYTYCEDPEFDTSYAAGIGPWGYAKLLINGATVLLPGSYAMLIAWAKSVADGVPKWMAPAGVKRASLGSFYVRPKYEIGRATLDQWQNPDSEEVGSYKVNPIMKAKNYGYVVYGNSTLLRTAGGPSTSMLQSISTRVAANMIKREAFNISLGLQFDQMVGELYVQFKTLLGAFLDQMKYQGALYDYRIVVDESSVTINNLNERTVPVTIKISPAPAAENFDITLEITKSGVTFSDDSESSDISVTD